MQPQNNALHLTRRRGVAASRPVVEGRLAGERECWVGWRGRKIYGPESRKFLLD